MVAFAVVLVIRLVIVLVIVLVIALVVVLGLSAIFHFNLYIMGDMIFFSR